MATIVTASPGEKLRPTSGVRSRGVAVPSLSDAEMAPRPHSLITDCTGSFDSFFGVRAEVHSPQIVIAWVSRSS